MFDTAGMDRVLTSDIADEPADGLVRGLANASAAEAVDGSLDEAVVLEAGFWASVTESDVVDVPDVAAVPARNPDRSPMDRSVLEDVRPQLDRDPEGRRKQLAPLRQQTQPRVLAHQKRLSVVPALQTLFPQGIQRGSTVQVQGGGATSLAMALAAGPMAEGSWMAVVDTPALGLTAAEQQGVLLHRMVVLDSPPQHQWGAVMAALLDAFDLVVVSPRGVRHRDARRLEARARERGTVLMCLGEGWPTAADVQVAVSQARWSGLEWGHGHLVSCEHQVDVRARGGREVVSVRLHLEADQPYVCAPRERHAGSDIDALVESQDLATVTNLRHVG